MNTTPFKSKLAWLAVAAWMICAGTVMGQTTLAVTNVGYQYFINGTNNTGTSQGSMSGVATNNCPPLFLTAGTTNQFVITVDSIHPVKIVTNSPGPLATTYSGATPQGLTSGTMTLIVPATNYPSTLYYECSKHFFYGVINILPPSVAPPQNTIISIVVTPDGITVTSTGTTTTYTLVPEFNSNLVSGTWQSVPTFTNTFTNGTNVTSFDRLDSFCGSNVFLRISQRP